MIKGNTPIIFIQGDTFVYQVAFSDRPFETIDKVVFSCDALSLEQEMIKDTENKKFVYAFLAEITDLWIPLQTTFDIIVYYVDGPIETQTGIPLIIKKRYNTRKGGQSTLTVDWSQIRNIPSAVQVITSNSDVTSDDNYNVDIIITNVLFDWKESGDHWNCGYIADELMEYDKHLVLEGSGGLNDDGTINPLCIDDFYLSAYQTKAIQELYKRIIELEEKIQAFKNAIK